MHEIRHPVVAAETIERQARFVPDTSGGFKENLLLKRLKRLLQFDRSEIRVVVEQPHLLQPTTRPHQPAWNVGRFELVEVPPEHSRPTRPEFFTMSIGSS